MLQPWLQAFFKQRFFSPSDSVSPTHPLEKGPLPEGSLAKGKMDTPLPQGCSGYQEGMVLNKDSPSWLWKSLRKHLAKGDNKNKAGKKLGAGTTSLTRKEKEDTSSLRTGQKAMAQHMTGTSGTLGKEDGMMMGPSGIAGAGLLKTGLVAAGTSQGGGTKAGPLPGPGLRGHSHPCKGER